MIIILDGFVKDEQILYIDSDVPSGNLYNG